MEKKWFDFESQRKQEESRERVPSAREVTHPISLGEEGPVMH